MKEFNHLTDVQLYFGNDDEQQAVIDAVGEATRTGKSKLHLVSGGSNTGKTSAIDTAADNVYADRMFKELTSKKDVEIGYVPGADEIPAAISAHLQALHDVLDTQHYVFKKDGPKPVYVVMSHGETAPMNPEALNLLRHTAELVKNASKEGYQLVWVADAPIMNQGAPIFKKSSYKDMGVTLYQKGLAALTKEFNDVIVSHMLHYDKNNIRECLWDHITGYGQDFLDHIREGRSNWDDTPEWKKTYEAALEGDRKAYDKHFDVLAKRMKIIRGKAA